MKKAVVGVLRNPDGAVLILKRGQDHKLFPGEWCFPGGKLDWLTRNVVAQVVDTKVMVAQTITEEESYEAAFVRETLEETGIQIVDFIELGEFLADHSFIVKVFHAFSKVGFNVTRSFPNREHVEYMWVTPTTYPTSLGTMTKRQLDNVFGINSDLVDNEIQSA